MTTILNVLFEERVGGPQLRVLQVARALREEGLRTIVVIPKGDPRFSQLLQQAGVPWREMDLVRLRRSKQASVHWQFLRRFWSNVGEMRRIIGEDEVEIVHTNGLMNSQAAIAAHLEGVRLVWHLNDTSTSRALRSIFLPMLRAWADCVPIAAHAVGRHFFPRPNHILGRLHLLYAPVDTKRFNPGVDGTAVRNELGIAGNARVLGMLANFSPGKGFEYLIEAAPTIKARFPDTKFVLVGGILQNRKAYWLDLQRRVKELRLDADVYFPGRREDVPRVLRAMNVYVHSSEAEACPMAVMEASASGLPVIATNVGGTAELVTDGVTGVIVPPRDPAAIADAALRMLQCPTRAAEMGEAGAERMRTHFSLQACVAAHKRVYQAALQRKQSGYSAWACDV